MVKKEELYSTTFDLMTINDISVIATPLRINRTIIPKDLYIYDVRYDDIGNEFATIEPMVLVNHCATIISKTPFMFENGNDNYIEIEDYNFLDEITLEEYINNY
jgi:uncharacterized protein YerC